MAQDYSFLDYQIEKEIKSLKQMALKVKEIITFEISRGIFHPC